MRDIKLITITFEVDSAIDAGPANLEEALGFTAHANDLEKFLLKPGGRVALARWLKKLAVDCLADKRPFNISPTCPFPCNYDDCSHACAKVRRHDDDCRCDNHIGEVQ